MVWNRFKGNCRTGVQNVGRLFIYTLVTDNSQGYSIASVIFYIPSARKCGKWALDLVKQMNKSNQTCYVHFTLILNKGILIFKYNGYMLMWPSLWNGNWPHIWMTNLGK